MEEKNMKGCDDALRQWDDSVSQPRDLPGKNTESGIEKLFDELKRSDRGTESIYLFLLYLCRTAWD